MSEIEREIASQPPAGLVHLMLHTLQSPTRQLELWTEHALPELPLAAGVGARSG